MSEMVERVAKAIEIAGEKWAENRPFDYWDEAPLEVYARAAIEAMAEPTTEMLDVYWHQTGESKEMRDRTHAYMRRCFAAMKAQQDRDASQSRLSEAVKVLEPFLNVRDQHPESVKLINGNMDSFTVMAVHVTKGQFLAAKAFLATLGEDK